MTELIISLFALKEGKLWVVQVSLLGSILSNALLVLGTAFFVGGLKNETQNYNKTAAGTNVMLMMVSCTTLILPAILDGTGQANDPNGTLVRKMPTYDVR